MNLFDQVLLKLFSIVIFVVSVALLVLGIGMFKQEAIHFIESTFDVLEGRIALISISLILALVSLRFLFFGWSRNSAPVTINMRNELGEMRTSITTFETIARKVIHSISGVKESQVRLKVSEIDGHQFFIKVVVDGEVPIPQLTEHIQREVKKKVEEITGVDIQQVSVLISDVVTPQVQKPRRVE